MLNHKDLNGKDLFPLAILAGGLATRLRPISKKIPKSLIPIHGRPFISYQLELLKKVGFTKIILCVGYLGELIENYVQSGSEYGLNVTYSHDETPLLGTAGAIKKALPLLRENFFIMYGDSYLPIDYGKVQQVFVKKNKLALMTIFKNTHRKYLNNIEYNFNKIINYNKYFPTANMHYIDYGLGLFNKAAFNTIPSKSFYDLAKLYNLLLKEDQLANYQVYQRFYEIGSLIGLREFQEYLKQKVKIV